MMEEVQVRRMCDCVIKNWETDPDCEKCKGEGKIVEWISISELSSMMKSEEID